MVQGTKSRNLNVLSLIGRVAPVSLQEVARMEQQGVFLTQEPPPSQGAGQEGRARRKVLAQKEREALVKKKMTAPIEAMKAGLHAAVFPPSSCSS